MSKYIATVIKTGNSYALRVPKAYVDDAELKLGEKATIELPVSRKPQDRAKIQKLLEQLQGIESDGGLMGIKDPVAWQRELRKDRPLPGRDY
jgi:antitoxin component of MazEF toxin-antitoxin module